MASFIPAPPLKFTIGVVSIPVNVGDAMGDFKSAYVFVTNCVPLVGVTVLVGKFVLNVFVPVQLLLDPVILAPVVYVASPYALVINCVDDVGVKVLVGKFVLKLLVPLQTLLFDCVAVNLVASEVLFTFPNPTIVDVIPETVPVKLGDASGAFNESKVVIVVAKFGSFPSDVAISFNVSKVEGAELTRSAITDFTYAVVAI